MWDNVDEKAEGYVLTDNYGWSLLSVLKPDLLSGHFVNLSKVHVNIVSYM